MNQIAINDNYISLGIELSNLPDQVTFNGIELIRKSSFHVSLVCVKNITSEFGEGVSLQVVTLFNEFIKDNPITFKSFKNEYRFAIDNERDRKTLIVMVEINNLDNFFENLRKQLNLNIDNQPTHVTLYTLKKDEGIGINNQNDLLNLTSVVTDQVSEEIKIV